MNEIGVRAQITELKRLRKFEKKLSQTRMFMYTFPDEYAARLVLDKTHENSKQLAENELYLLPELAKEESVRKNLCLKKWRELINDGVPNEKLKVQNFDLFNGGEKWR